MFVLTVGFAQVQNYPDGSIFPDTTALRNNKSTGLKKIKNTKAKITDYLIISHNKDTTYVDTSLTIKKNYKFNYLRKDNFGLLPFANIGQTYNSLTHNFKSTNTLPSFGARARHFNYLEIDDIFYYNVPTPLTELLFKTAFEQGQLADSFFTVNTSPQLNFSIAYKGLRSIGKYQSALTSTGNFRFTTRYRTKNDAYIFRGHIVTQDLFNEENGGLQQDQVANFESGLDEFRDRSILAVNLDDEFRNQADNILEGKRFYFDQTYHIIKKTDSTSSNINVKHTLSFEDKFYQFNQATASNGLFGEAFTASNLRDRATLEHLHNKLELNLKHNILGDFKINAANDNYNYGYNRVVVNNGERIPNRLKGDIYSLGAAYNKRYKGIDFAAQFGTNISGNFKGDFIKVDATYHFNKDAHVQASLNQNSKAPNYNVLLYQSDYINYNWRNDFDNVDTRQVAFKLESKKYGALQVDYTSLNNYTYFARDANRVDATGFIPVRAFQNAETINYLRVRLDNELRYKKVALQSTLLYQNVKDANGVLNLPEFTTRNTLYYATNLFKKALYLQTGVTLNYFTSHYLDAYDPVLAEFYVQNDVEIGNFPRLDFFIDAKIRQTRIYLKAEHFNSSFTGFNFFSAPNNPYRDFAVRFGLVWNFFL